MTVCGELTFELDARLKHIQQHIAANRDCLWRVDIWTRCSIKTHPAAHSNKPWLFVESCRY